MSEDDVPPVVSRHPQRTAASAATAAYAASTSASAKRKADPAVSMPGSYGTAVNSRGHGWEQQPLSAWSVSDTVRWLEDAMQLPEAASLARSVGVDGLLLGVMTDSELHIELGLSSAFQRKKLLVHLDTLRALDTGFPSAAAPPVSRLTAMGTTAYTSGGARSGVSSSTTAGGEASARSMPSDDAMKVEVEAHRTMEEASLSWFGAELARIRATATATRAASRLLLSTLEGKKEVAHNTLQSTQAEIQRQREPIDKVRRPSLRLVP
eukprot:COSAG02_NODE_946_length_15721_cov_11.468860_4_plen_266_part_00